MARMNETREANGLTNDKPEDPVKMPDPFDPVKREWERAALRIARLRGGRLATILSPLLKGRTGIGRTRAGDGLTAPVEPTLTSTTTTTTE